MNFKATFTTLILLGTLARGESLPAWDEYQTKVAQQYNDYETSEMKAFNETKVRVSKKWTDGLMSGKKTYVKYDNDDNSRVKIDFEHGEIVTDVLLTKTNNPTKREVDELTQTFQSVVSDDNESIISKNEIEKKPEIEVKDHRLTMRVRLNSDFYKKRALKILSIIEPWCEKYKLSKHFVLAIIRQESGFNPRARSWVPAFGLMQIVPKYAGLEVNQYLTGLKQAPEPEELFTPTTNVKFGTTYLKIIRDNHFTFSSSTRAKTYLVIAAYNWGPHRILKSINQNRIHPKRDEAEVFQEILAVAPLETRNYLQKVVHYENEFQNMGI